MPKKKITTEKKATPKKTVAKKTVKKAVKKSTKKAISKVVSKKKVEATKKPTTKNKSATKSTKALVYSDDGTSFWVTDGKVLNSLLALNEALNEMEDSVFSHHVTDEKHDFAEWVEVVLADAKCAEELRKTKTPNGACRVVSRHLRTYKI